MVIATFGPSTGWVGKTITFDDEVFTLEGHGPITAREVMHYDEKGHLAWPSDEMRAWCAARAGVPLAPAAPADSSPAIVTPQSAATPAAEASTPVVTASQEEPVAVVPAAMAAGRCSACSAELAPDFRFCPYCGVSVEESAAALAVVETPPTQGSTVVVEDTAPPAQGITIEFGTSSSQSFEFALDAACKLPGYREVGEGKKLLYQVTVDPREIESTLELVELMKGWRRRAVYVDGEKTPWDAVFGFGWCYEKRKGSYRPDFYCFGYENDYQFNLWGCLQAGMPFSDHANWFTWGRWLNKHGDWEFDKARIRHELEKMLFRVRFCPAMQDSPALAVLDALPDKVNPNNDKNWKFVQSYDESASGLRMTVNEFGFKQTVVMKGVAPNGRGAFDEIGKRLKAQGRGLPPRP